MGLLEIEKPFPKIQIQQKKENSLYKKHEKERKKRGRENLPDRIGMMAPDWT